MTVHGVDIKADRKNTKISGKGMTHVEIRRRYRQREEQCEAVPAVTATPARMLPARDSSKLTNMLDVTTADDTVRKEELHRQPLGTFEDVLIAVDEFLGVGTRSKTAGFGTHSDPIPSPFDSEHFSTTSENSRIDTWKVPRTRHMSFNETNKSENGKLLRLYTPSSTVEDGDETICSVGRTARTGTYHQSFQRNSKTMLLSGPASSTHNGPCRWKSKLCVDGLDDDPLDLMLRCRENHRPEAHEKAAGFDTTAQPLPFDPDPEAETHRLIALKGQGDEVRDAESGVPASAGVFRISNPGTGFVHYGYTWDITRAKAHQLRLLRGGDDITEVHPHRGLAAVVRGQHPSGQWSREREIRFEVVRLVPLPLRFSASEFDHALREACVEELVTRRSWLLVLMARHVQRKHLSPAFQRFLATCRYLIEVKATAAAAEVQRSWRGYLGRVSARLERDRQARERMKIVAATWAQARHRDRQGRLRVAEVQNYKALAPADEALTLCSTAATRVQRWLRASSQLRLDTATGKDGDATIRDKTSTSTNVDGKTPLVGGTGIELINRGVRGFTRPFIISEVRAAGDLSSSDEEVSPRVSGRENLRFAQAGHSTRPTPRSSPTDGSDLQSPRPLSSQDVTGYNFLFSPLSEDTSESLSTAEGKRYLKPPREGPGTEIPKDTDGTVVGPSNVVGVSQLVIERDTLFASARAIQATWRGFVLRLGIKKRKRAVAALRRKREGKWRQQRGVVGKQVAVGWDDRRELEEGMAKHGDGANEGVGSPCVDIQRLWRGALSRIRSRVVRERQKEEREASVQIQRVFRGARGRRHARKKEIIRGSRIAAAHVLTKHVRHFVWRGGARQRRRDHCATTIQRAMRRFAAQRDAHRRLVSRREHAATHKVQSAAKQWLGGRQAQRRKCLRKMGACALCFKKLADVFLDTTEQELCLECYERTRILFADRGIALARSEGVFEISVHRKRDRSATFIQRAWLRSQQRTCGKYGTCEACNGRKEGRHLRPRAAKAVCLAGCDHRRHVKYCRRCCAIVHSVRATAGHEIRSVDQYGADMAAVAKLWSAMWRYHLKWRFWRFLKAYRKTLNSRATSIQSRWRCYRCRSAFSAFSKAFVYLEAAAKSVDRLWPIVASKGVMIPAIARFQAHSVHSSPPGIYAILSGYKAVWETNIMGTLRLRAVEKIKRRWKEKMLRVEAKSLADTIRSAMVERQRLHALAELQAAVDIERTWQGYRGRSRARRRAAIIAFARETAKSYASPSAFAITNLRAFNTHGGFLGSASIDARSLLAVAAGDGAPRSACFHSRRSVRSRVAKYINGRGEISLRLTRSEEDGGLAEAVAGITELTLRICLRRCNAKLRANSGGALMPARQSEDAITTKRASATLLTAWMQRDRQRFRVNGSLSKYDCDCDHDGLVDDDEPPLTLKLELISVHNPHGEKSVSESEGDAHRLSDRRRRGYIGDRSIFSDSRTNETGNSVVETRDTNDSTAATSDTYGLSRADTSTTTDPEVTKSDHTSDSETSDNSDSEANTDTGAGDSAGGTSMESSTESKVQESQTTVEISTTTTTTTTITSSFVISGEKHVVRRSWNNQLRDLQYQCEVSWCGRSVGGTRAPLRGLPIPRWEGQVFYLPLCEAGDRDGTASMPVATTAAASLAVRPGENLGDEVESPSCEKGRRKTNDKDTLPSFPPLLTITLNKLGKNLIWGNNNQYKRESSWLRFISGLEEPVTVGRAVLEAGDVLGMLGSQQLVNMPAVSKPNPADHGVSGVHESEEKEDSAVERSGWQLRLLLSLEGRERTRTRLMVAEIVTSLITEIVDLVPGMVARIELRVVGTRPLDTCPRSSPSSRVQNGRPLRIHGLYVSVEWNGAHAGGVGLSPSDDQAKESSPKNSLTTHDDGFEQARREYIEKEVSGARERISDGKKSIFMLPLNVPSVVGSPIGASYSIGPRGACHAKCRIGRGVEKFRPGWDGGESGAEGGRSQCLRVIVITKETGGPRDSDEESVGASSSRLHRPLTRPQPRQADAAVFYEHDLLRDEWTEFLIPISNSSFPDSAAAPATAVVLQARSVGFHPKVPPMWLVRRDFAEKTVGRMISAALAAVAQPRVEVTLVGLFGDIASLLHTEDSRSWNRNNFDLSPRAEEGHDCCKEILCQAFWNGTLAYELRLHRVAPCLPEHPQALVASTTPSSSLQKIASPCDFEADDDGRDAPFRDERDPATWFFDGQAGSDSPLQDNWVKLDDAFPSEPLSIEEEKARGKVPTPDGVKETGVNTPLPSTTLARGHNARKTTPSSLSWVPIEGERYAQRPFRFFLPSSLSETAGINQNPAGLRRPCDGDGRCPNGDENVDRDERTTRCRRTTGSVASDRALVERATITGSLSLVFLAVVPSIPNSSTACSDAIKTIRRGSIISGSRPKVIKRGRRPLGADREQTLRLVGCVRLENEELFLQPPGKLVELQMLGDAGFYKSTAWTMAHDLARDIHANQVTSGSTAVVIRHFDVPGGLLRNLRCPAPLLEVEVIDGHGLTKAPGQLSTNPYVVLTMNGEPFARSTTYRGATRPIWMFERFRVKLPPPNTGAWPLTTRDYFRGFSESATTCILGVEVYNDTDYCARRPQSRPGIGDSDALLGKGYVSFLQLKSLPYFYIPVHLSSPSGLRGPGTDRRCTTRPSGGGGGAKDNAVADAGLLGIGLRMLFPNPSVPDPSAFAFCAPGTAGPSRLALDGGVPTWVAQPPSRACHHFRDEIVLRVHEAENLATDAGTKRSINPFCVVLVNGVEVGRTQTILDSSDPLWATSFHLSNELLLRPSQLNITRGDRPSGQNGRVVESIDRYSRSSCEIVSSVDFEVRDRVAHGQPVLVGAAKLPTGALGTLLMRDSSLPNEPAKDDLSATAKIWRGNQLHSLKLSLPSRENRQQVFPESGGISAAAAGLEAQGFGMLCVSVEQAEVATRAVGEVEETTEGADEGNVAGGDAADSGRSSKVENIVGRTTASKGSLEAYHAEKLHALAETSRGARAGLEQAREMASDTSPAPMGGRVNDLPRDDAERFVRAWKRETTRAEQEVALAARRSPTSLRQEWLDKLEKRTNRKGGQSRSTDPSRSRRERAEYDAVETGPKWLREEICTRQQYSRSPGDGEVASSQSLLDEDSSQNADEERSACSSQAGHERDGKDEEDKIPPTALEQILPTLPAARREICLHIRAVSGLGQPFHARGNPVLAKVFWGRQEVGCTTSADAYQETTKALDHNAGDPGEKLGPRGLISGAVSMVKSALMAAAETVGGTVAVQWTGEKFRLPLPDGDLSGDENASPAGVEEVAAPVKIEATEGQFVRSHERDESCDGLDSDLHLRIEVWQGKRCHGQVELQGLELLRICKRIENATAGDRADFEVDCGNGDMRLPDHFPHFLRAPEAMMPYKLPLVPRDGEAHKRVSAGAPQARLSLVLLLLELGQMVAAQGQLASALEALRSRAMTLREKVEMTKMRRCRYLWNRRDVHGYSSAEATTGIVAALTNVLTTRPSPLSFRLESLVLHADTGDDSKSSFPSSKLSEYRVFFMARRGVIVYGASLFPPESYAANGLGAGNDQDFDETVFPSSPHEVSSANLSAQEQGSTEVGNGFSEAGVLVVEEIGRSSPLTIRSPMTILPGWSFAVPPDLLVADHRRREYSTGGGSATSAISADPNEEIFMSRSESCPARLVLDLVTIGGDNEKGSLLLGDVNPFVKSTKESGSESGLVRAVERDVLARAVLDPPFLRRLIGRRRSVKMKAVRTFAGAREGQGCQPDGAGGDELPRSIQIDVAGHAVSKRRGSPRFQLQVMECQNLRKADVCGKSDPCVLVFWEGRQVGRTLIVREDLNPVFPAQGSVFWLPLSPPTHASKQSYLPGRNRFSDGTVADWAAYTPNLRLEVWDMDRDTMSGRWKRSECLGTVVLKGPHDLAPILEGSFTDESRGATSAVENALGVMLRLRSEPRRLKSEASKTAQAPKFVSGGLISIKLVFENETDDTVSWISRDSPSVTPFTALRGRNTSEMPSTNGLDTISSALQTPNEKSAISPQLQVVCLDARGLPLGCDAYCRVYWNGRQVGRTITASASAEARNRPPPSRAFQKNPVWWTQSSSISTHNGQVGRTHPLKSCATACISRYEASEGDELIVEIFDANQGEVRRRGNKADTQFPPSIRQFVVSASIGRTASDDSKAHPSSGVIGSHQVTTFRPAVGVSLGTVTISGRDLHCPFRGRIDFPVVSARQEGAKTLGISLEHLPTDEPSFRSSEAGRWGTRPSKDQQRCPKRWLRLQLIKSCLKRGLDLSGTSDPYCVVYIDRVWHDDSHVCWRTLTPRWNHWVEFEIFRPGSAAADLDWGHEVRVEVWDKDCASADDFIGEVSLSVRKDQQGEIEVHAITRSRPKQKGAGQGARPVCMQRSYDSAGGALVRHSLELCREGERQAPPRGQDWIGTLTCTTQVYTEKNWSKEVESMHLPWSLGAVSSFSAGKEDLVVLQIIGIVREHRNIFPVPPGGSRASACFALIRWNGKIAGRTPYCRELYEPNWHGQIFALQSSRDNPDEALEIEFYYAREGPNFASGRTAPTTLTAGSIAARCPIEGPFICDRFPQYATNYPLLRASKQPLSRRLSTKTDGRENKYFESGKVVGAVNLRITSISAAATGAEHAEASNDKVIGDRDSPDIRRRKTNTVERRLRLWIWWVSLARLLHSFSETFEDRTRIAVEPRAGDESVVETSDGNAQQQSPNAEREKTLETPSTTCESQTPKQPGISCRVVWCGVLAAVFQLCPRTGLPLTPGECLLPLPRGMNWSSCSLTLEVIATHSNTESSCRGTDRERNNENTRERGVTPSPRAGKSKNSVNMEDHEQHRLLGAVMIGWQAIKSLQEQAYCFTTCPEEAVPQQDAPVQPGNHSRYGGGHDRLNLVCSLCIPTTSVDRCSLSRADHAVGQDRGKWRGSTYTTDDVPVCCRAWRVLPAHLALSIRLERLSVSRPPRPARVPPAAPEGSVCRLRIGLVGQGASLQESHPDVASPGRFLKTGTAIVVGWNGHSSTVGPRSEWQLQLRGIDDAMASDSSDDILLPVPPLDRERLVLTLGLKRQGDESISDLSYDEISLPGAELLRQGRVAIDWDGLSCLPLNATNYFVDIMDGRSSMKDALLLTMPMDLELVAPTSSAVRSLRALSRLGVSPSLICVESENADVTKTNHERSRIVAGCRVTTGVSFRLSMRLEESPVCAPHELSLTPIAAGGPGSCLSDILFEDPQAASSRLAAPTSDIVSPGDFRDPCRRERVPYIRFLWPWDDRFMSLVERRTSLAPSRAWSVGARRAVFWPQTGTVRLSGDRPITTGNVGVHLPLVLSGIGGWASTTGSEKLRGDLVDVRKRLSSSTKNEGSQEYGGFTGRERGSLVRSPVLVAEAFDMGNYGASEHRAARTVQRLWRRAFGNLDRARLLHKRDRVVHTHNAAVYLQMNFRGWKGRLRARAMRQEAKRMIAGATALQRRWRANQVRAVGMLELLKRQKVERRVGLSLLIARGAGVRGMGLLSGLSNPFCVVLWNTNEIGRTAVRYSTRYPNWVGGEISDNLSSSGRSADVDARFELPFFLPKVEAWGREAWPPLRLEIRCYDHNILGPPELIGRVVLSTDDVLAIQTLSDHTDGGCDSNYGFDMTSLPGSLTWLELQTDEESVGGGDGKVALTSSGRSMSLECSLIDRNPFKSRGEIAVALTSNVPLPASLSEYKRPTQSGDFKTSRDIAEAGVWAVVRAAERALSARDRGLWVVDASGLRKADLFGKSDPYVKVFWDGREIGTTAVRRRTLNPVWFSENDISVKAARPGGRGQLERSYFLLESACSLNPHLRVEVYDWDAVGSHDFLGGVELSLYELVELQRVTLAKVRANGGRVEQQMLLKTDYPLRSRDNEVGNNGSVGLCVYLDLEQRRRITTREQAASEHTHQAAGFEVDKADARIETEEAAYMATEDIDASEDVDTSEDMQLRVSKQQKGALSPWQAFYDDAVEPPIPFWYNSVTGESTSECPSSWEKEMQGKTSDRVRSTSAAVRGPDAHQDPAILKGGVGRPQDQGWQLFNDYESSPGKLTPWWFNPATGESTWEKPVATPCVKQLVERTPQKKQGWLVGRLGKRNDPASVAGTSSAAAGDISSPWTRHWSEEHQAFYFQNDLTLESTWNAPDTPMPAADETVVNDYKTSKALCENSVMTSAAERRHERLLAPDVEERSIFTEAERADGARGTATFGSNLNALSSRFPFFVNARGNRVFAVPRSTVPPS